MDSRIWLIDRRCKKQNILKKKIKTEKKKQQILFLIKIIFYEIILILIKFINFFKSFLAFSKEALGIENKKNKLTTEDIYNAFKKLKISGDQIQIQELSRVLDFNKVKRLFFFLF